MNDTDGLPEERGDGRRSERRDERPMRLFVACYPSADAVAELDASLGRVREAWPALRWTPAEQWHLTLAFYGDVAVDRVDDLIERVARAAGRCPPLALRLTRFGAFPSARRARVCWVAVDGGGEPRGVDASRVVAAHRDGGGDVDGGGIEGGAGERGGIGSGDVDSGGIGSGAGEGGGIGSGAGEELRGLAARCVAAGRRIGVPGDGKPYRPHLTVARPRKPPLDVSDAVEALADHDGPPWVADEIRLVRSHLGVQVRHECIAAAPLVGARTS